VVPAEEMRRIGTRLLEGCNYGTFLVGYYEEIGRFATESRANGTYFAKKIFMRCVSFPFVQEVCQRDHWSRIKVSVPEEERRQIKIAKTLMTLPRCVRQ